MLPIQLIAHVILAIASVAYCWIMWVAIVRPKRDGERAKWKRNYLLNWRKPPSA